MYINYNNYHYKLKEEIIYHIYDLVSSLGLKLAKKIINMLPHDSSYTYEQNFLYIYVPMKSKLYVYVQGKKYTIKHKRITAAISFFQYFLFGRIFDYFVFKGQEHHAAALYTRIGYYDVTERKKKQMIKYCDSFIYEPDKPKYSKQYKYWFDNFIKVNINALDSYLR